MTHTATITNTNTPIAFRIRQGDKPVSLSGATVSVYGKSFDYANDWIAEASTNVTVEPTWTFTADATTGLITHERHRVQKGDQIQVSNSGGALPTGLASGTTYFAIQVTENAFALAATPDGKSLITGAGTGTQSYKILGMILYAWQTADVANTGSYRMYVNVTNGGKTDTYPDLLEGTKNPGFVVRFGKTSA